ncbi:MAG: hypothetical protein IPK44_23555 [Candidatus Accumulibacter sp.]|uniref:M10 family metallopeptidase C-terminal domain-containing protein n=1 Tax=Accumulibacter sp. TaxID=2053492 RepID=UPI00258EB5CD|nr:hypothetical protein [Accumulibacter sp.]MBK8117269.1 hypothetical protein [Accumulibacter sp.]
MIGKADAYSYVSEANENNNITTFIDVNAITDPVSLTGINLVDALLWGWKWTGSTISLDITTDASDYVKYKSIIDFTQFMGASLNVVTNTLAQIGNITALQVVDSGMGDVGLRVGFATGIQLQSGDAIRAPGQGTAEGNPPGDPEFTQWAGDAWFNTPKFVDYRPGTWEYLTIMHEIGHTLGLKHGHVTQETHTLFPQLFDDQDSLEYSIMTYSSYPNQQDLDKDDFTVNRPLSFMQGDIAALQYMYGADFDFNSGDTTYKWSPTDGSFYVDGEIQWKPYENYIFQTIWDGKGEDTYDFSNYSTGLSIDLNPGAWTITSEEQRADLLNNNLWDDIKEWFGTKVLARGNIANALLYQYDIRSYIENAVGGSGNDKIAGNDTNNKLFGGLGDDTMGGGLGNDTLVGGAGKDSLNGNHGIDTADYSDKTSAVSVTLNGATAATVTLGGVAEDSIQNIENLIGGSAADYLNGDSLANILNGGSGNDILVGGLGNDTYLINTLSDVVTEKSGEGTDLIQSAISYSLIDTDGAGANGGNVENLQLTGAASINGTGNILNNVIYANSGINSIDGGVGSDAISYFYASTTGSTGVTLNLSVINASGQATASGISGADLVKNVENITGSNYKDTLTGNAGANVLDGGAGVDTMIGGDGSDIYYVRDVGDLVSETNATASTGGTDLVYSYLSSHTLGANVENGRILTTGVANLTGNTLNNVLYAGAGNNGLNGGSGIDTVSYAYGLAGTSGVTVSLAVSTAQATVGSGSDTLTSIENLFGSAYADRLTGNTGANSLDGGTGSDTLAGGDGSDGYFVRDGGDVVSETNAVLASGGTDTVYSYLSAYTLTANVENGRILATLAANLTGNTLNNVLYAGAGNNVLNGGTGSDSVSYAYGLAGTTGVTVSLAVSTAQATSGSGSDTLTSIENLFGSAYADKLTGNSGANSLGGGAGNDTLDGGAGSDTLAGGDGSDGYFVRDAGDVVSETNAVLATGGTDTVYSTLAAYTLTANVENGRILATVAANLTGNTLNNVLYAGAGNNVLDGGTGTDTVSYAYGLAGTTGVTVSLAVGTATGGSGSDTLTNIENLIGSGLNDNLTGNAGNNTLDGAAGNDLLTGGVGRDVLTGGAGSDTFDFNVLSEMGLTSTTWDVINDFVHSLDKIDVSTLDANAALAGNQAFSAPVVGGTFSGAFATAGDLYFDNLAHVLYGNTDADTAAEIAIQLVGVTTLTAADLFL